MGPVMETDVFPLPHINFSMQLAVDSLLLSEGHSGLSGYQKGQFSTESLLVLTTLQFQCHDITSSARQQTDMCSHFYGRYEIPSGLSPGALLNTTVQHKCSSLGLLSSSPCQCLPIHVDAVQLLKLLLRTSVIFFIPPPPF